MIEHQPRSWMHLHNFCTFIVDVMLLLGAEIKIHIIIIIVVLLIIIIFALGALGHKKPCLHRWAYNNFLFLLVLELNANFKINFVFCSQIRLFILWPIFHFCAEMCFILLCIIFNRLMCCYIMVSTFLSLNCRSLLISSSSSFHMEISYAFVFILSSLNNHWKCYSFYMLVKTPSWEHLMMYVI